jgi:RecB family exonuclease
MKTTIDIPDRLLRSAKAMAARRGTTLKTIITHALEREVYHSDLPSEQDFAVNEDGVPYLPPRGVRITSELVTRLLDEEGA